MDKMSLLCPVVEALNRLCKKGTHLKYRYHSVFTQLLISLHLDFIYLLNRLGTHVLASDCFVIPTSMYPATLNSCTVAEVVVQGIPP